MKESIYRWMEQLSCYLVIVTAALHMLPDSEYRKYVRLFTGLVLILLLAAPVFRLFHTDISKWETEIRESYESELEDMEELHTAEKTDGNSIEVEEIKIGQ